MITNKRPATFLIAIVSDTAPTFQVMTYNEGPYTEIGK